MLGIIITGHGGFASGLAKAMEQILGEQPYVAAIDFPESSTTSKLEHQLAEAMSAVEQGDGVVFLTDLLGGNTFSGGLFIINGSPQTRGDHRNQSPAVVGDAAGA